MGNPILDRMQQFSHDANTQIWQSVYSFEPSAELLGILNQVPDHQAICYDNSSIAPNIGFDVVDLNTPGVRIRISESFLYLTVGQVTIDSFPQSFDIHHVFLHFGLYYPKENDLLEYWKDPSDALNNSEDYIKPVARSEYLGSILKQHCGENIKKVLEIGCNLGRNLAFLKNAFDFEVSGIEINQNAVNLLRKTYAELAESHIRVGDAKTILKGLPDNSIDVVYSMAVLMHMHPTSTDTLWMDIVRVAKKYIITIENEVSSSERNWARNYQLCFEQYGAKCIYCEEHKSDEHLLLGYTTRVFDCRKN